MKAKLVTGLVLGCLIVGASVTADAQRAPDGPGGPGGRPGVYDGRGGPGGQGDNRGRGGPGGGPGAYDGRGGPGDRGDHRGRGGPGGGPGAYDGRGGPGRGPGYDHRGPQYGGGRMWRRGDRYDGPRSGMWQVQDWRRYRGLYAPPPGYYWVQYGNQFLLTALATGIISNVIANAYGAGPMGPAPY